MPEHDACEDACWARSALQLLRRRIRTGKPPDCHNEPITARDLEGLEQLLFSDDGVGSRDRFVEEYGDDQPLGLLVRRVCGLDRNAAKAVFADFLHGSALSADQMTFIDQLIDRVCANGFMEPEELSDPPFSDLHDDGVVGVFPVETQEIIATLEQLKARAMG
ncbi:MAG: type I restriction-modification enzyme R subunit C-terminal domain-containing protein [Phycisphaerales bacterium JB038]